MSKRGKIRYRERSKRWYVDLHWQGKRYKLYHYLGQVPCKTKDDAKTFWHSINDEINKTGNLDISRYQKARPKHLKEYAKRWLTLLDVESATLHDYKNSLKNHILPVLGDKFLPDITYDDLRALQKGINRAPKGKKNVMDCLRKLMRDAYYSKDLPSMPEPWPRLEGKNKVVPPKIISLTEDQQFQILDEIPIEDRYIFLFMKLTGCRPAEARAFRKIDIRDTDIIFEMAFDREQKLKTVKGRVAKPFPLTAGLQELFDMAPRNLTPFVFLNSKTGRPYTKNINRDLWNPACKQAIGGYFPLYKAMRHSFGCQMLNAGVDKGVVQRLLRHSDSRMTDRYAEYATNTLRVQVDNVISLNRPQSVPKKNGKANKRLKPFTKTRP